MCKEMGVKLSSERWYEHVPKPVETSLESTVAILWNQQVQTDRTIPNSNPGIIIRDNKKRNMRDNRCFSSWIQKFGEERS